MSAESGRKKPYSLDVLLRVVYQRIGMSRTFPEIAKNLDIAVSNAYRTFRQFEVSGDIAIPTDASKPRPNLRVLNEHSELIVVGLILENRTLQCNRPTNLYRL